jgi:uncharacterized protein YjbJ (UPF0337 family)
MADVQTLQGNWNEVRGKIGNRWSQLAADELKTFDGNLENLVAFIQRKTGDSREAVEKFLDEASSQGSAAISGTLASASDYVQDAVGKVRETVDRASEIVEHGYEDARKRIQQRPVESLVACFGVGMALGLLVALAARQR